jgi:ribosome-binding protein aMBF1 (putative translation factor)
MTGVAKSRRQRRAARPRPAAQSTAAGAEVRDAAGETIAQLRRQSGLTQVELAAKLEASQRAVSHVEHEPNPRVETLASYVAGLGGRLELRAVFADRSVPIRLPGPR